MKKVSITLVVVLILQTILSVPVFAVGQKWPSDFGLQGRHMPFRPEDKYVCEQNPPDFSWPAVNGAVSYDLKVCRDEELTDIAYEKKGVTDNFYNFDTVFETGTYYWSVSYRASSGLSEWTEPRRFRITSDATEFPVPSLVELMNKVPAGHPRIYTTAETMDEFRAPLSTPEGKAYIEVTTKKIRELMKLPIGEEPKSSDYKNSTDLFYKLFQDYWPNRFGDPMYNSGLIYLLTGDEEIGRYGVDLLMAVSSWDQNGPTSYVNQDQVHRDIAYKAAFAYDWLYNLMTEQERETALKMIKERTDTMAKHLIDANVSIKERPYESHGWTAFTFIITISFATCHDLPEAKKWLEFTLPTYINVLPPWSNEDGGWSQGTYYYQASNGRTVTFEKMLSRLGIIDISKKAWLKNEMEFPVYFAPAGSSHTFGDNAYTLVAASDLDLVYRSQAVRYNSGIPIWALEEFSKLNPDEHDYIDILYSIDNIEPEMPLEYKNAKRLKDVGWVAMHSNLVDQERISLYFKSSPFGSFNHSHADQNTFVLRAFGERLAIDSGYYAYGTTWEDKYVRQTFAHNGITINGGKGQTINSIEAKGSIEEFLTHPDFDMVKGDAAKAYKDTLSKAERYVLYVRPDIFIVIDDLKAASDKGASYEFWLNGMQDSIKVYENGKGARLQQGSAVLDAMVQYPEDIKHKYSNIFSGADLVKVETTDAYKNAAVQQRIWFSTNQLPETKMITTLDVHHEDDNPQYIQKIQHDGFMELSFENGARAYINTSNMETVNVGEWSFDGVAMLVNDSSVMLVSGTRLMKNGEAVAVSDKPMSVVSGHGLINVSVSDDTAVTLKADLSTLRDEHGNELNENTGVRNLTVSDGSISATLDKGDYNFCSDGAKSVPQKITGGVRLTLDGKTNVMQCSGNKDAAGNVVLHGRAGNKNGMYRLVSASEGTNIADARPGDVVYLDENVRFSCYNAEDAHITLEKALFNEYESTEVNHEEYKASCETVFEAESFVSKTGATSTYNTRAFLSAGVGVTNMNTPTDSATYEFEVPKSGNYKMVIKNVAWLEGTQRQFILDSYTGMFACPLAVSYGTVPDEWKALMVENEFYLEKGKHTLTLRGLNNSWNIDWIGFKEC